MPPLTFFNSAKDSSYFSVCPWKILACIALIIRAVGVSVSCPSANTGTKHLAKSAQIPPVLGSLSRALHLRGGIQSRKKRVKRTVRRVPKSPNQTRRLRTPVTKTSRRAPLKLPDYKYCGYRINASNAPGCWPGPAVRFIEPSLEDLEPYGEGGAWPMKRGEEMPWVDWEKDFGGIPPPYIPLLNLENWQKYAFPGDGCELWFNGTAPYLTNSTFLAQLALNEELWECAKTGQLHRMLQAASRGADVRSADPREGYKTAMHWAADGGFTALVGMLAKMGANISAEDSALWTPLHCAARSGHTVTVAHLVSLGASVNATCGGEFTPLHWAAARGHTTTVGKLVELGACLWATDWQWRTPLQLADFWNHSGVVRMLGQAMQLPHDPVDENCGPWWWRHVVSYDMALRGEYSCWCSVCECPCEHGEKDPLFLMYKTGLGPWNRTQAEIERVHISLEEEFREMRPDPADCRHYTLLHPIYNVTWNRQAKERWRQTREACAGETSLLQSLPSDSPGAGLATEECKQDRASGARSAEEESGSRGRGGRRKRKAESGKKDDDDEVHDDDEEIEEDDGEGLRWFDQWAAQDRSLRNVSYGSARLEFLDRMRNVMDRVQEEEEEPEPSLLAVVDPRMPAQSTNMQWRKAIPVPTNLQSSTSAPTPGSVLGPGVTGPGMWAWHPPGPRLVPSQPQTEQWQSAVANAAVATVAQYQTQTGGAMAAGATSSGRQGAKGPASGGPPPGFSPVQGLASGPQPGFSLMQGFARGGPPPGLSPMQGPASGCPQPGLSPMHGMTDAPGVHRG